LSLLYLDLDELPGVLDRFWFWSARRAAPGWFRRADFLGDARRPLADCVRDCVATATGVRPQGPIRLLTHLRQLGHNFNPVSFYYCFDVGGGGLEAIVAEITNTPWKQRHAYVLDVAAARRAGQSAPWRFDFDKQFHVSPFMPMGQQYRWRFSDPGDNLAVFMENWQDGKKIFDAGMDLNASPLSSGALARSLATLPAATLKILVQIYWQALRLLLKRTPFHQHPEG
jgi:DUF1365 family protein